MRRVTYAGETIVTSDRIASLLVDLSAALAKIGQAEAVTIPIVQPSGHVGDAELVVGLGNDVLSVPCETDGRDPDFAEQEDDLRRHPLLNVGRLADADDDGGPDDSQYDPDLDVPRG